MVCGTLTLPFCCFVRRALLFAESLEASEGVGVWRCVDISMTTIDWGLYRGEIQTVFFFATVLHRELCVCNACPTPGIPVDSSGLGKNRPSLSSRQGEIPPRRELFHVYTAGMSWVLLVSGFCMVVEFTCVDICSL